MEKTYTKTYYCIGWSDETIEGMYGEAIRSLRTSDMFVGEYNISPTYEEARKRVEELKKRYGDVEEVLNGNVHLIISKLTCTIESDVKA